MQLNLKEKLAIRLQVQEAFPKTTTYEELVGEIVRLRRKVQELEKTNSDYGWQLYPDRMGQ